MTFRIVDGLINTAESNRQVMEPSNKLYIIFSTSNMEIIHLLIGKHICADDVVMHIACQISLNKDRYAS
jgi:hypothetical protein